MMGITLWHLGNVSNKCISTSIQCYRTKLHAPSNYIHARTFKRIKSSSIESKAFVPDAQINPVPLSFSMLWKPLGFTVMFGGTTLIGATIWQYERIREQTYKLAHLYRQRTTKTGWRGEMQRWWLSLTDSQRVYAPILFLNVLVFLAWRVPALSNIMLRYFSSNPTTGMRCWPMLLSTFSHYSFFHLAANMYVLHTFCPAAVAALGKEQFVGVYLTSGVVASLASYAYRVIVPLPGVSLGASGAIMGILGFVCTQYPDIRLSVILLPMYTFTASTALKALIGLDLTGCILGWKFFDHAAHLGGVLFGVFWKYWGEPNIWHKREPILKAWHQFREPPKSY